MAATRRGRRGRGCRDGGPLLPLPRRPRDSLRRRRRPYAVRQHAREGRHAAGRDSREGREEDAEPMNFSGLIRNIIWLDCWLWPLCTGVVFSKTSDFVDAMEMLDKIINRFKGVGNLNPRNP